MQWGASRTVAVLFPSEQGLCVQDAGNATSGVAGRQRRREACDRRVRDDRECCPIIRESCSYPGFLGGGESSAQSRPRRNATGDEVGGLERENRSTPTRRQG